MYILLQQIDINLLYIKKKKLSFCPHQCENMEDEKNYILHISKKIYVINIVGTTGGHSTLVVCLLNFYHIIINTVIYIKKWGHIIHFPKEKRFNTVCTSMIFFFLVILYININMP